MKTTKTLGLTAGLLLLLSGSTHAQHTTTDTTTQASVYRVVSNPPPPSPLQTAADSARERARLTNAEYLRREATAPPTKVPTNIPLSPMTGDASELAAPAQPTPEEVARIRDRQRREMIDQALSKKGQKRAKSTTHTLKKLDRAGLRE